MNKKTKMWLGVGVVAAAAYYFWHKSQSSTTPATTAKLVGSDGKIFANAGGTCNRNGEAGWTIRKNSNNVMVCASPDGMRSYRV